MCKTLQQLLHEIRNDDEKIYLIILMFSLSKEGMNTGYVFMIRDSVVNMVSKLTTSGKRLLLRKCFVLTSLCVI